MEKHCRYIREAPRGISLAETLFFLLLGLNLAMIVNFSAYTALYERFNLMVTAAAAVFVLGRNVIELSAQKLAALGGFFVLCLLAIRLNHSGNGVLIQFIWPLSVIFLFRYSDLSPRYAEWVSLMMLVVWLAAVLTSWTNSNAFFAMGALQKRPEGINPNTTAIVVASSCLLLEPFLTRFLSPFWIRSVTYVLSGFAIAATRSRTSLISFILVALLGVLFEKHVRQSRRLALTLMGLVVLVGILFPIVYVALFETGMISSAASVMGKSLLTGRQYIWLNVWEYLKYHKSAFLWGTGYNTDFYAAGSFNLHNAYLQIFAQFGLPVFLLYFSYLFHTVGGMYGSRGALTHLQFRCFQVILLTLAIGYGETILSYLPNLIFFAIVLGIGCRETDREDLTP